MTSQNFSLQPFAANAPVPPFSLTGAISRSGTRLTITYTLAGPLQELVIAPPGRRTGPPVGVVGNHLF